MKQDMIDGRVEFLPSSQEERKCWVAICLEIDLTSQGERFLEAAENIQDALKKWVCACIEHETLWFYKVSHRKNQKRISPVKNKAQELQHTTLEADESKRSRNHSPSFRICFYPSISESKDGRTRPPVVLSQGKK